MNWALIIVSFIIILLAVMERILEMNYEKIIKEKDLEIHRKNTEISLLNTIIQQLRVSKGGTERIIYRSKTINIPKGTIDAVKLAMKVSHPDNGGKQEDFIKYNEVYQKLTGKR